MPKQVKLLLPKFLTQKVAMTAIRVTSRAAVEGSLGLNHTTFHVVVLVPAMEDARSTSYKDWPNYPVRPYAIAELSVGNVDDWPYDFADIAKCKALQLWTDRNDGSTDIKPHLLFPSDTPYWGGVKRDGIVVTCSGVQSWFDRMIAGITADICIALAYDAWMKSSDKADGELCFLT